MDLGRTPSGALVTTVPRVNYESVDGGFTWTTRGERLGSLERQEWRDQETKTPSGAYFRVQGSNIVLVDQVSGSREAIYSFAFLQSSGNMWMQALERETSEGRYISTKVHDLFFDDLSGNLIVAMGLQGVVVVSPDGTSTRVAVGPYSPTDFSLWGKARTYFGSMLQRKTAGATGLAFLLTLTFAVLALAAQRASLGPKFCFAVAAAIAALLAISLGVYPQEPAYWYFAPGRDFGDWALILSGFGLFPLALAVGGLIWVRASRRQLLSIVAASIGMLALIALGALVLFQTGTGIANFVAVGLVGLASIGLWAYQKRTQNGLYQSFLRRQDSKGVRRGDTGV